MSETEVDGSDPGGLQILVCDDDASALRLIQVHLEEQGHEVTGCTDSRRVIDLLETQRFDVAILDMMMPYVDGFELLKYIRTHDRTKHMKVGIMTAMAAEARHRTDLPDQADWYISKPIQPWELIQG